MSVKYFWFFNNFFINNNNFRFIYHKAWKQHCVGSQPRFGSMSFATQGKAAKNWAKSLIKSEIASSQNFCNFTCTNGGNAHWAKCIWNRFIKFWINLILISLDIIKHPSNSNARKHQVFWGHLYLVCFYQMKKLYQKIQPFRLRNACFSPPHKHTLPPQ